MGFIPCYRRAADGILVTRLPRRAALLRFGAPVAAVVLVIVGLWLVGGVLRRIGVPESKLGWPESWLGRAFYLYAVVGLIVYLERAFRKEDDLVMGGVLWPIVLYFDVPREVGEWRQRKAAEQRATEKRLQEEELQRRTRGVQPSQKRSATLSAIHRSSRHIAELGQQVPSPGARTAAEVLTVRQSAYVEQIEDLVHLSEWLERQAKELRSRATQEQARAKVDFVMQRVKQIDAEVAATRDFLIDSEASLLAVIATQDEQATSRWFARYSEEFERHYELTRAIQAELASVRDEQAGAL